MKKVLFILLVLQSMVFNAQFRGGNRPTQNQQSTPNFKPVKFSASKAVGVFYYDIDAVIKKIKVKDETLKVTVKEALKNYNQKIRNLSFKNSEKFKEIDVIVSSMMKRPQNMSSNENSINRREIRENINKLILPIRKEVKENEIELNTTLASILSEKQNGKWLKLQEKKKKSLQPKRPSRSNRQNSGRRNGNRMRKQ